MIRNKFLSLSLLLIALVSTYLVNCDSEGTFTIAAGTLLKFHQPYRVAVAYQGYKHDKVLQIGIKQVESNSSIYENFKNVTLRGDGLQNIDFDLSKQPEGYYVLKVDSMSGEDFNSTRSLHMNIKKYSTFIQTDKSVYKPGDIVKFRIVILDVDTKPFKFDDIEIFITDGGEHQVKKFEDPKSKFVKGVYKNELQLSDSLVQGRWQIHVRVNDNEFKSKSFDIEEYDLPKFELVLDVEPANYKDGKIRATVKAKYTFGKMAKGTAKVTAVVNQNTYHFRRRYKPDKKDLTTVIKHIDVDGKKFVEFDMESELKMNKSSYNNNVVLTATFVEEITKKEVNVTKYVHIERSPYKLDISYDKYSVKSGLPFKFTAKLSLHDKDMPITDKNNPIKFHLQYKYDVMSTCITRDYPKDFDPWFKVRNPNSTVTQRTLTEDDLIKKEIECRDERSIDEVKEAYPVNGLAEAYVIISGNITEVEIKLSYLDTETYTQRVKTSISANNQFLQAHVISKEISTGQNIKIRVESNTIIKYLIYKVIGGSNMIDSKLVRFNPSKEYTLEIMTTPSMGSSVDVLVYYITEDGELVSDKVDVNIDNLGNYMNLHLSTEQAEPSENINITIDSNPHSYIGLLGVDQSVLLVKHPENDIDSSAIAREKMYYQSYDIYNDNSYGYKAYRNYEDFRLGIFAISNAKPTQERESIPMCYDDTKDYPLDGYNKRPEYDLQSASAYGDSSGMSVFKGGQISAGNRPIKIRKEFPETWLFEDFDMENSNKHVLTKKVPDTITSWIITGFSLNPNLGLGLTKEPTKLNVFQPFFVSTNLPYSIKRGEVVSIPFSVFNYLGTDQNVIVKFFNSDRDFEFVEVNDAENSVSRQKRALEKERTKEILVKSNEGSSISFMIRPLKVGHITIKVTAESQLAGDGVERQLKVEPEGVTQYFNEAVFVDLRNQKNLRKNIQITVPSDAVEDSTRMEASVIGDILGPTLENLDNLIQLPYGCAEQNMLKFVPNILVLEYLTNLNKLNPETEAKLKKHLDVGYQKQLTYKNKGGSYSGFGMKTENGSTWLTAYVAKSFNQASKYIDIDQEVITEALDFLNSVQSDNGSFPEFGHVSYTPMQGGASKGIGLTAYTLITFLENKQHGEKYKDTIKKSLDYVVKNIWELDDIYALAIASYALQLARHETKDELLAKLNNKAEEMEGMKYWKKEIVEDEGRAYWFYRRRSTVNVEMTSYAMLAFILAGHDQQTIPIMKWLVSQRNYRGGFQSTQDTVVGLQALSQLASKIPFSNNQMRISIKPENSAQKSFDLNDKNSLILQKAELPSSSRTFEVTANGTGFAILQISYKYNLDNAGKHPRFNLKPTVDTTSNKEFLNLKVCTNFVPDSQDDKSNMAIMEVTLPSGFTFDNDHLTELMTTEKVKKVETKDGDTVIMVYFDDIEATYICPSFHAYRTHAVANHKPAPIVVYDYYDNSRHARAFYNPPEISLCDICQGANECKEACEVPTVN
ncbi:unnamed protein product [Chironomus riparius]|uniref:CD109 antigen n=1 Tax=Chironomus riparius TaxID=315576 RepID=A0A9N9WZB1_9DIPT|nr:unnamed protein product [Chironomus riparius]